MKHLIALSMKYIRRQKLRTFLTFMCITLSAFILTTICCYGSSLYTTLYNEAVYDEGKWEVDISSWLEKSKDTDKAADIIRNHAVVDDYFCTETRFVSLGEDEDMEEGSYDRKSHFMEISDGKNTTACRTFLTSSLSGNADIIGELDKNSMPVSLNSISQRSGIYVPMEIRDMGYSEGDTISLTVRPAAGVVDEDSDIVKNAREELKEKYGTEYCKGEKGYDRLTKEQRQKAYNNTIENYLRIKKRIPLRKIPYTDLEYGEPVTFTFKIAGFITPNSFIFRNEEFITLSTDSDKLDISELYKKNPQLDLQYNPLMKIRLIDNCDYDEALKMLFTDLGFDYDSQFLDEYEFPQVENTLLLALELKSPYAMYKTMVAIVPMLIVLLIGWFISRFVIDNTFEMAVQERSTHFAAMRIMGASKTQIAFVVLNEALFYCFTAIPLGMILAVIVCRLCFNSLKNSGIQFCEFSAKPLFIAVAAFLTIIALFISAYTSAMWASRKLSPAEALNFGKPKSKRKLRKRKSKLNLSSRKWLRRYTKKNIKACKSRFIVATITMALGVAMFTATALIGNSLKHEMKDMADELNFDFYIDSYVIDDPDTPLAEPEKYFSDKEIFPEYYIQGYNIVGLNSRDGSDKIVSNKLMRTPRKGVTMTSINIISEFDYNKYGIDKLTGISYEEYKNMDGVFFNNSIYGSEPKFDEETGEYISAYEKSYTDLGKGFTITDYEGHSYHIVGKLSGKLGDGAIIIPAEKAPQYGINSFDILLNVSDAKHYDAAKEKVNDFAMNNCAASIEDIFVVNTGLSSFISAIVKIVASFLISIWLVGVLSMINSVNTSVLNRSRELMMLRSVGMTKKQLRKSVMLETIMFSTTAAVSGAILGTGLYMLTLIETLISKELRLQDVAAIPAVVALALGINVLISIIAAIPAIKNLNKVESIAQAANG